MIDTSSSSYWFCFSGKYEEMSSKSGHAAGGESQGMDPNAAMLEKEHEEITKVK